MDELEEAAQATDLEAIVLDCCSAPSRGNVDAVSLASIVSREPCLARPLPRANLASRLNLVFEFIASLSNLLK